jgi:hypothetical protein
MASVVVVYSGGGCCGAMPGRVHQRHRARVAGPHRSTAIIFQNDLAKLDDSESRSVGFSPLRSSPETALWELVPEHLALRCASTSVSVKPRQRPQLQVSRQRSVMRVTVDRE